MGEVARNLVAKLNSAGLTDEEKIVLAIAVSGAAEDEGEVQGFGRVRTALEDLEAQDKLGNFEIQNLTSSFNQAETLASSIVLGPVVGTFKP